jgi:sugar lactone lactonase YvrE
MTRFAGNGRPGNAGDGAQAAAAQLLFPMGIAVDAGGNVFVADRDASVVRRIAPSDIIQTVAGNGKPRYTGDGGPATSAQLNGPFAVAVDAQGGLYIADTNNLVVRKVSADGTISTYAGSGTQGFAGDGGAAAKAWLNGPEGVALDASGNLYIADTFNGRIRRVGTDGTITTAAGVGSTGIYGGDNGPPASAALSLPTDVAVDRTGSLYIADFGNSRVRVVANAVITSVAGRNNGAPIVDGEEAVNARLNGPTGVGVDSNGNFYFV